MFPVRVGKLRVENEEDISRVRAECERRSVLVVNEALGRSFRVPVQGLVSHRAESQRVRPSTLKMRHPLCCQTT